MKKSQKIGMTTAILALTGYGAWALYKKYNPDYMKDMELAYKRMSRDVEKTIDDMMQQ